ncbi:restriction endonuclease subunit S [Calidifontibacter terrae]
MAKGYTVFRNGDILAAKITPCWENGKVGQAKLSQEFGVGSTEFHIVRPTDEVHDRYLLHFLRQPYIRASGQLRMTGSGGQRRVPASFLSELSIPLPPFPEQRRIAAILDQADAIRTKRREVLAHLNSLDQSIFEDHFSRVTETDTLRSIGVNFVSGKNVLGSDKDAHSENRVIKVSAISRGTFAPDESKPMPRNYVPPNSHRIREGDILFGRASGSLDLLGATAVVDVTPDHLYLPDKVWRLTVEQSSEVSANYVLAVLRSPSARSFIRHNAGGAAGVRNISKSKLLDLPIPVPPLSAQAEFENRIAATREIRSAAQRALKADDELFASLQSRAFRGEL